MHLTLRTRVAWLAVVAGLVAALLTAPASPVAAQQPLELQPSTVLVPPTPLGERSIGTVRIRNVGAEAVPIGSAQVLVDPSLGGDRTGFSQSGGTCNGGLPPGVDGTADVLQPGSFCTVVLTYAPRSEEGVAPGRKRVEDVPVVVDGATIGTVDILATAQGTLVAPRAFSFGSVEVGTTATQAVTLTNLRPGSAQVDRTTVLPFSGGNIDGVEIVLGGCAGELMPGASCTLSIRLTPVAPDVETSAAVSIRLTDGETVGPIVRGSSVAAPVVADPTEGPTEEPTEAPTGTPTEEPTGTPTEAPTEEPTEAPRNRRPRADAGGPYILTADTPAVLDAIGSDDPDGDPLAFAWDLDGDGAFDDGIGRRVTATFSTPGEVEVRVRVTDPSGSRDVDADPVTVIPAEVPASFVAVTGLEAGDNVDAALAWSRLTFPDTVEDVFPDADGTYRRPHTVLLGRDDVFADSLASGGAQGLLGAPLLVTPPDHLDPRVRAELLRILPDRVILLGGTAAVSTEVEQALAADGFAVERAAGASRIETAVAVARAAGATPTVAVLTRAFPAPGASESQAFADALAAGGLAATIGAPLLLTASDALSTATAAHLTDSTVRRVLVVGGEAAIAPQVLTDLEALGLEVERISGASRFATATALAVARGAQDAAGASGVVLVDGGLTAGWADAFPAALASARWRAPIVLANATTLPPESTTWLSPGAGTPLLCGSSVAGPACLAAAEQLG